jgi:tripartite-type tricarboxylate transporter receptor subunit TctC
MRALPNKNGASGVIQDMLRGDVHAAFLNVASSAGMVQSGKFRAIALVNNERLPAYPNVPTMKEAGFADVGTIAWNGMFAPAKTPKPILEELHAIVLKALASDAVKEKFGKQKMEIAPNKTIAEAHNWLDGQIKHWQTITTQVKIDIAP